MKNIMILNADETEAETLQRMITEIEKESRIYVVNEISKAYQIALERSIDLFVVDVTAGEKRTAEVPGIEFVGRLRELQCYHFTPVIFLSSLEEVKMYAYTMLRCYGYMERPYHMEKLKGIITKALTFPGYKKKKEYAVFRNKGIFYYFRKKDIVYIENMQRKVWIHAIDRDVELSYITCPQILNQLNSEQFLRCSKNTIVNLKYIKSIDYTNRYLELKEKNIKVEIGSVLIKQFKKELKELCETGKIKDKKNPGSSRIKNQDNRPATLFKK